MAAAAAAAGGSRGGCVVSRRVKTIATGEAEALSMLIKCETGSWRAGWPLSEVSTWPEVRVRVRVGIRVRAMVGVGVWVRVRVGAREHIVQLEALRG
eukprot:scaffold49383_cov33-Phaeocystis_antarctica.AAC.1